MPSIPKSAEGLPKWPELPGKLAILLVRRPLYGEPYSPYATPVSSVAPARPPASLLSSTMIQAFKKQRVEPKHTRTDKSCIACAKSKSALRPPSPCLVFVPMPPTAKCERTADPTRCKKCAKKNLRCQWPEGEASRRACDEW